MSKQKEMRFDETHYKCAECGEWVHLIDKANHHQFCKHVGNIPPMQGKIQDDPVNHPKHYTNHPSGIGCIQITRHMGFNLGNALKYIWRADLKGAAIEDLKKAIWYIQDEIAERERKAKGGL